MSELEPDDTPKPDRPPTGVPARPRGDYYYDDATGYEIYKPDEGEDDREDEDAPRESPEQNDPGSAGRGD